MFSYKAPFNNGLTEHEFDHVFVGDFTGKIEPNPDEVQDYCFKTMEEINETLINHSHKYTAWFHIAFPKVFSWWEKQAKYNNPLP